MLVAFDVVVGSFLSFSFDFCTAFWYYNVCVSLFLGYVISRKFLSFGQTWKGEVEGNFFDVLVPVDTVFSLALIVFILFFLFWCVKCGFQGFFRGIAEFEALKFCAFFVIVMLCSSSCGVDSLIYLFKFLFNCALQGSFLSKFSTKQNHLCICCWTFLLSHLVAFICHESCLVGSQLTFTSTYLVANC